MINTDEKSLMMAEAELKGRSLFLNFTEKQDLKNLAFSENKFSHYDCSFIKDNIYYICEIKRRDMKYLSYNDMLLEVKKLRNLKSESTRISKELNREVRIAYCFVFDNGDVKIANITDVIDSGITESHSSCTECNDTYKKEKNIIYLHSFVHYKV